MFQIDTIQIEIYKSNIKKMLKKKFENKRKKIVIV